jgi:hypothetical protein
MLFLAKELGLDEPVVLDIKVGIRAHARLVAQAANPSGHIQKRSTLN